MLPPIDPSLLSANPLFQKLHARLDKDVLDSDASTRDANVQHQSTSEFLEAHRVAATRQWLLTSVLLNVACNADLPSELRDLMLLMATYASDGPSLGLTPDEDALMAEDVERFNGQLPQASKLLSESLAVQCRVLASIASAAHDAIWESKIPTPGFGGGNRSRQNGRALRDSVDAQVSRLDHLHHSVLPSTIYETTNALVTLLQAQAEHLHHIIRHLERRKHGADARHLTAKAHFLSTVAQGLEAKARVAYLERTRDLYSPAMVRKLEDTRSQLGREEDRLEQRRWKLQAALREYDDAGVDVMQTLGKRYAEIEKETQEVKDDVERLVKRRSE